MALNLGPEEWQSTQARSAYRLASHTILTSDQDRDETVQRGGRPKSSPKLFISLDMNVLPSTTHEDMSSLVDLVLEFASFPSQLRIPSAITQSDAPGRHHGKVVLSTFGGGESQFGGAGWEGFLAACRERGEEASRRHLLQRGPSSVLYGRETDRRWTGHCRSTLSRRFSYRRRRSWVWIT